MPAQLTRTCPGCNTERATPEGFREPGETGAGRPPVFCRVCRVDSPELQARHARAVAKREGSRDRARAWGRRSEAELLTARDAAHPDGLKVCPARSGCGDALPFSAFAPAPYQPDALESVCIECGRAHDALLPLKSSPVYTH